MSSHDNISVGDRPVCDDCIGEEHLAHLIALVGVASECYYCSNEGQTITIEQLSEHVARAFDQYFIRTASEPEGYEYYLQRETGDWDRSGEPVADVIAQALEADDAIAEDVREVLDERTSDRDSVACGEEQPFSDEAHYTETASAGHASVNEEYRKFEAVVIEQARYFSPAIRHFLASLFGQLEGLRARDGRLILVEAGPGLPNAGFFRARAFQDDLTLKEALAAPDRELGPPPPRLGRAGRLNAAGVSIFYGADVPEVALAEVRPPVGSRVVIARFDLLRTVRLLDIDAMKSLLVEGSLFDPKHFGRLERAAFLESFSRRFTQPVMPDHEAFEYIPTQVVADYLANELEPVLDGIVYASPQSAMAGRNVALFHRSSRVERRATPEGMVTTVWFARHSEDEAEIDYRVFEELPPLVPKPRVKPSFIWDDPPTDPDTREPALRIDLDSIEVRHIEAVEVRAEPYQVTRSQYERLPATTAPSSTSSLSTSILD